MGKIVGLVFEKPSFVCPVCGKEYKSEEALNKHIADKHPAGQNPEQ